MTTLALSGTVAGGTVADATAGVDRDTVLDVCDLHTEFGKRSDPIRAVRGVSFQLQRGRTLVLLGESGSGKSVTARSVLGLYGRSARITGTARLGDLDLLAADESALQTVRGRSIALVPQDPTAALDPLRRIGSQLTEVLRQHGMVTSRADAVSRGEELLRLVGIPDPRRVARSYPHQLSGGMRQRAVIAIAVSCEPSVLFADEPTTALDVTVQAQILELFADLQQRMHMAILLVTHDVGVADQLGHDIGVMYAGRIVERGATDVVLDQPAHPYTRALLASLPQPGIARGELRAIPGRAVLAGEAVPGCPFASRCGHAVAACTGSEPDLVPVGTGATACSNEAALLGAA